MDVQKREHTIRTFITHQLVHVHQKKNIAAKIASVNRPLLDFQGEQFINDGAIQYKTIYFLLS
jgi:hypothetical protein